MDALSTILASIRLRAGVFSRARLHAPWAVHTRRLNDGIFHVIVRGTGRLVVQGHEPVHWTAGDLLVLPHGHAHVMAAGPERASISLARLPTEVHEDGTPCVVVDGEGEQTSLLCGSFETHPSASAFVLDHLPPILHVHPELDGTAAWFEASLRMLTAEQLRHGPGSAALSARLAEMLFVQVLREAGRGTASGWLAAVFDPHLGRALAAMHDEPARPWSAAELARVAGLGRSAFYARFGEAVGESPSAYLTRWRMVLARMALSDGATLIEAAEKVGYGSEASFAKAFKRVVGQTPGGWRASC